MKTRTCLGITLALVVTSMLTMVLNIRYARATVPFSDEFSSFVLGSRWAVVDPDGGSSFDITANPGWLRITTTSPPERDLYGPHATNAPRIMQSASENFTIETRVMATTDENDEGGGILVWKDSQNFLLFNRLSRTIGHPVEQQISLCAEGGGGGRRSNHTTLPSNLNPTYLKLVRSGDLFSGYYRSDETTWVHAADLTFSIDDPVDIGLNVINTYHEGIFSADFDYFRFAKLVASRKLSIKLSGDFDYSSTGKVEVKVAALVKDADTMEAVSDAKVTVDIYYQDGALWVSDDMTENHAGTGIYEWESSSPFILYIVSDEIFLVHVKASVGDGPVASDMLLLHIDAFADRSTFSLTPLIYYGIAIIALAAGAIVGIVLLNRHRKIRGTPQRMHAEDRREMEDQRNVKWIVIISLIMLFVTLTYGPTILLGPYNIYYPSRDIWFYVNRLDTLLFLATVTTGALFGARFGKKELTYKLTLYFFIISMGTVFLILLMTLFISVRHDLPIL